MPLGDERARNRIAAPNRIRLKISIKTAARYNFKWIGWDYVMS
jgi:hypothetical protein